MYIRRLIYGDVGKTVISIILGLGLATLFRHACINRNCIVINGPNPSEIQNNNYKYNNKCYKYNAYAVSCDKN